MTSLSAPPLDTATEVTDWIARIQAGLIGEGQTIAGPFGTRPLVNADFTASGRSLDFIENAIAQWVLPFYGNTHTETSATGLPECLACRRYARHVRCCFSGRSSTTPTI